MNNLHYTVSRLYPNPGTVLHRRVVAAQWLFWLNTCELNGGVVKTRKDIKIHPEWLDNITVSGIRDYVRGVQ